MRFLLGARKRQVTTTVEAMNENVRREREKEGGIGVAENPFLITSNK
jgi:hypothetical protein